MGLGPKSFSFIRSQTLSLWEHTQVGAILVKKYCHLKFQILQRQAAVWIHLHWWHFKALIIGCITITEYNIYIATKPSNLVIIPKVEVMIFSRIVHFPHFFFFIRFLTEVFHWERDPFSSESCPRSVTWKDGYRIYRTLLWSRSLHMLYIYMYLVDIEKKPWILSMTLMTKEVITPSLFRDYQQFHSFISSYDIAFQELPSPVWGVQAPDDHWTRRSRSEDNQNLYN